MPCYGEKVFVVCLFVFSNPVGSSRGLGRKMEEDGFAHRLCLLILHLRGKWQGEAGWHNLLFGESAKKEFLEFQ